MKKLTLPELSPQAAPEFIDAPSAKAWLENVPLANVAAAQQQLLEQIREFNGYGTSAASRLATLDQRQLTFVAFLLERWAEKVDLLKAAPAGEEIAPLVIDLESDFCPERDGPDAADPRYLDVKRLAKSLRNRIGLLRKGESPAKLALGEDCVQPSCEQLLVYLYRLWCQVRQPRGAERKKVADVAQASHDMAALHYYISGRVFKQPGHAKELTQQQRDQIATFGRVSTRDEDDYSVVHGFVLEHWRLEDESTQGLKMVRRAADPGKRYSHGQLIGGKPAATAVRPTGLNVQDAKYVPALSLTGVAAQSAPPSLVLPSGWFKPKRVIKVYVEGHVKVRLTEMIERGSDFERVAYEMLS